MFTLDTMALPLPAPLSMFLSREQCSAAVSLARFVLVLVAIVAAAACVHDRKFTRWVAEYEVAEFAVGVLLTVVASRFVFEIPLPKSSGSFASKAVDSDGEDSGEELVDCGCDRSMPVATNVIVESVPPELFAQLAAFLGTAGVSELSLTSNSAKDMFWNSADVWQQLASDAHLGCLEVSCDSHGAYRSAEFREAFRCALFNISHACCYDLAFTLRSSGIPTNTAVLNQLARMARGLMPVDGSKQVDLFCDVAELALQAHDFSSCESAGTADSLLAVVRTRSDIFTIEQLHMLEGSHDSAYQLDALMETAMIDYYDSLPSVRAEQGEQQAEANDSAAHAAFMRSSLNESLDIIGDADDFLMSAEAVLEAEYQAMHDAAYQAQLAEFDTYLMNMEEEVEAPPLNCHHHGVAPSSC